MAIKNKDNSLWLSYSDLMTSLFFVMLVLFIMCIVKMKLINTDLQQSISKINNTNEQYNTKVSELENEIKQLRARNIKLGETNSLLNNELDSANATKEQLIQILQLDKQFEVLSKSSELVYIEEKKTFVAKDFIGIEIFEPNDEHIKKEFIDRVDNVGRSLQNIIKDLYNQNPLLSFQMVIEGNAAIRYNDLIIHNFNPDNYSMYLLSYKRALELYLRWRNIGLNFRDYNTEIIISGSGFNGINRDTRKEDNNKRFVIQIIPKISKFN